MMHTAPAPACAQARRLGREAAPPPAPPAAARPRARRCRASASAQPQQPAAHAQQAAVDAAAPGAPPPPASGRRRALATLGCACCAGLLLPGLDAGARAAGAAAAPPAAQFAYSGTQGPSAWPGVCGSGSQQSPIRISRSRADSGGGGDGCAAPPAFAYAPAGGARVKNTGTTLQVNLPPGSAVDWGGRRLSLLQFHFHSPSEHEVDGAAAAMEAHLVHRDDATGGLAVVAVLLEAARDGGAPPNPALAAGLAAVPEQPGTDAPVGGGPVDAACLLPPPGPQRAAFVSYRGSLTTPPCSEGVDWLVFTTPQAVPARQVDAFRRFAGANARPLQPLNGRALSYSCLTG